MKNGDTSPVILESTGLSGDVQFRIGNGHLSVSGREGNLSIPDERLDRIEYRPGSWRTEASCPAIRLAVHYRKDDGREMLKQILLSGEDSRCVELLRRLEECYPDKTLIGPNEREKQTVLADSWRGRYGLHALHILTPLGIITGLLLVSLFVVSVILAEDMPVRAVSLQAISRARYLLIGLGLVPAVFMVLIIGKIRMTLSTDHQGLTICRVFGSRRLSWRDVEIGKPSTDVFNVYTGMFCYYSDRVNVISSRDLLEIPLLRGSRVETTLRLNFEQAAPLFRELYYRGKVAFETARKIGAFL